MKINFLTKICLVWGIFWGILGLTIYFVGLLGWWYPSVLITLAAIFLIILIWLVRFKISDIAKKFSYFYEIFKKDKIFLFLAILFILFILFNLIGALAPEKEFDALWYHLTIPKIYLQNHQVQFIPGGLYYYSVMPRLSEMLYGLTLAVNNLGVLAKILHFSFGIFWALLSFELLRKFFSKRLSLILTISIYSLFNITWLSSTAYIDLIVIFYVTGAFWGLISYLKEKNVNFLYLGAIFMGFALESKTYALMVLAAISLILILNKDWRNWLKFSLIALLIGFPFYLEAYIKTGNPIYPVFSIQDSSFYLWIEGASSYKEWVLKVWPLKLPDLFWRMMVYQFAPFLGLVLLLPFYLKKKDKLIINLSLLFLVFFILWSLLPVWEPRYFLMILPIAAILVGFILEKITFKSFRIAVALLIILGISYNVYLSWLHLEKPARVVFSKETRTEYLEGNVGSIWFNFYDPQAKLDASDKILTVNFHNLFYVPVEFKDWSVIENPNYFQSAENLSTKLKEKNFTYIVLANTDIESWTKLPKEELDKYFIEAELNGRYHYYKFR